MARRDSDWKVPPLTASMDERCGWMREAVADATTFLKSQRTYIDMDKAIDIIAGFNSLESQSSPRPLSAIRVNRSKRNVREIVSTLSNIRPMWSYKNDNHIYDTHTVILNKLITAWWHNTFADRAFRKALQYAAVMGAGYINPVWQRSDLISGRSDIILNVYGPRDVLFVQLPQDHNIQKAYATIIRVRTPIHIAHSMFPTFADQLVPTGGNVGSRRGVARLSRFMTPMLRRLSGEAPKREDDDTPFPYVDIYHAYILDGAINVGPDEILMGEPGTNWEYKVPYLQQELPTGVKDLQGHDTFRKANPEDAKLYPFKRRMIATDDVVLSDGPSPYWHGRTPLIRVSIDDWPWEPTGYSMLRDSASIQASNNRMLRAMDDSCNARLRPSFFFEEEGFSKTAIDEIDARRGGYKVPARLSMGKPFEMMFPPGTYDIPSVIPDLVKQNEERMDHLQGIRDITALAKAKQIPNSESIDKIVELAGPLVSDISRNLEASLRELGEQAKSLFFQWYTISRRIQILGADGTTEEDFDYKPGELIPAHLPGEDERVESPTQLWQRAKWHQDNFFFHVTPWSALQVTQVARQMKLLQLYRSGGMPMPMDPWTLAEAMDIPNFGPPPEATKNVMERWVAWMRIMSELKEAMGGAGGKQPGRPPSGQKSPQLVNKGGRQVVKESK